MDVHLIQAGAVGRKEELLSGMAGQRKDLFQRYLDEVRGFVRLADEVGYAGYGHNEHHLQIEGFGATNHPGMFSQFVGNNSTRLRVNTLGYVAPTHNPVRAAEEIAMLDHILQGRLAVGFVRGYQDRWVANYAAVPGARAAGPSSSSCPRIRPGPCTSATAGMPPSAPASRTCSRPTAGACTASTT